MSAMKLYFTEKQIPELAELTSEQQRTVRRSAFDLLCEKKPTTRFWVRLFNGAAVLVGVFSGYAVGQFSNSEFYRFFTAILVGTIVVSLIELVGQSLITERLRPYFRLVVAREKN
ncbi:MAG TPA: hypothetical protein VHG89_12510 [Verrucomicrobiae bacterium]|nr:hypothetical protein [Verrucomicrobiae bacterium]